MIIKIVYLNKISFRGIFLIVKTWVSCLKTWVSWSIYLGELVTTWVSWLLSELVYWWVVRHPSWYTLHKVRFQVLDTVLTLYMSALSSTQLKLNESITKINNTTEATSMYPEKELIIQESKYVQSTHHKNNDLLYTLWVYTVFFNDVLKCMILWWWESCILH